MKRGVKLEAQPTNAQRIRELDVTLKNMQVSGRISQMMIQQTMQNFRDLSQDLGKAYNIINELQYRILAMQSLGNFDIDALSKKANELRLKDFNDASDAEDLKSNFTVGDVVEKDSTVIITSVSPGVDAGIFRSRIKLADSGVPELIDGLMGKPVGTKVKCELNGVEHEVELLGIRNPPPQVAVEQTVAAEVPPNNVIPLNETVH